MTTETFSDSEELKNELKARVSSLKKQSTLFLGLMLVSALAIVYLWYSLEDSHMKLEEANTKLEESNAKLKISDSTNAKLKEKWRTELIETNQNWQDSLSKMTNSANVLPEKAEYVTYSKILNAPIVEKPDPNTSNIDIEKTIPATNYERIARVKILNNRNAILRSYLGYLVYIQDVKGGEYSNKIQAILKRRGFSVPGIEHMDAIKKKDVGIRYFYREDEAIAATIQTILYNFSDQSEVFAAQNLPLIDCTKLSRKGSKGQLEIWIDK